MKSNTVQEMESRRADLCTALAHLGDMRPGSLYQRFTRCGKPGCHCAQPGDAGHGPIWSVTHEVAGKTLTRTIPPSAVELTRMQIAEYRHFRDLTKELLQVSERLCDARLAQARATSQEEKKRASKSSSRPKSSRR